MKSLILFALLTMSSLSFAQSSFIDAREDLAVLGLVVTQYSTYSETSGLEAKVVELLVGDGMNATRMALVVADGMGTSHVFELPEMMYEVKKVEFVGLDLIKVTYIQETFDADENTIKVEKSIKVQALRFKDGSLSDSIKVLE
ncbi:hypothetical protein SHI21_03220 [Bacteriovorax sp. PP10]|uniref:Uncharacterized protein n=1 Tax=Bacteriovorax antarcticus TaxID=3088717 RepID=A0ABU5VQ72_9BACT|nr:hypothetical protein [Bacteriovorax sp. PP10]MEA9355191.1 hypothetical protein [Bacteriovorax sp. PP10]